MIDFAKKIEQDFPELYSNVYCGMSVPTGWESIIQKLSEDITKITKGTNAKVSVAQVKEKFGSLRYYVDIETDDDGLSDKIRDIIREAEDKTQSVCQICGEPAKLHKKDFYYSTLCSKHLKESVPVFID